MQRLFRAVKIISPTSAYHGQVQDILVEQGLIKGIGTDLDAAGAELVELPNAHVSSGWIDLEAEGGDPDKMGMRVWEYHTAMAQAFKKNNPKKKIPTILI